MKKIFVYLLALLVLVTSFSTALIASADFNSEDVTKEMRSYAYYMISLDNSSVMFSKNEDKQIQPAAFNKLLAAIVAVEGWGNLDESITVSEKALSLYPREYGIKTALIKAGDTYTKRELIDCLVVYSANDALSIIAYEMAGSKEAFCQQMSALASKAGCTSTRVVDIFGFDAEGQYTTAKDVVSIVQYGLNYPAFSEAFSAREVIMPATGSNTVRTYPSGNKMMNTAIPDYYHSSVTGGKQTSTDEAGECIAVISSKDGYSYLTVVMKGKLEDTDNDEVNENTCMVDAQKLLNWVYSNIKFKVVATPGQVVQSVDIVAGKGTDSLKLTPEKEISALVPSKVSSSSVLITPVESTLPKKVKAPVNKGDVICQAKVIYANKEIATINLVASETVGLSFTGFMMNTLRTVLKSKIFIALEVIALIVLTAFLIIKLNDMHKETEKTISAVANGKTIEKKASNVDAFKIFNKVFAFFRPEAVKKPKRRAVNKKENIKK